MVGRQFFDPGEFLIRFTMCVLASCHPRRSCHNLRGWYERAGDESASLAILFEETSAKLWQEFVSSLLYVVKP